MKTMTTPRATRWSEIHQAVDRSAEARAAGLTSHSRYWSGVATGYLAAWLTPETPTTLWVDDLAAARSSNWARPLPLDAVAALPYGDAGFPGRFFQSGVLFGYLQATADDDDAAECSGCGDRVLTDRDDDLSECSVHGWFHDACRSDGCDCRPEREFDKDAYYDAKYGS